MKDIELKNFLSGSASIKEKIEKLKQVRPDLIQALRMESRKELEIGLAAQRLSK